MAFGTRLSAVAKAYSPTSVRRQSILGTAAVVWAGALILGAFIASRREVGAAAYALSVAIYGVGAIICHQRPERSFHLWGAQLPVCARCAGIYLGAAVAVVIASIVQVNAARELPGKRLRAAIVVAALPTLLTLTYEWTTGHMPANWVRALAGFPLGAIVAWVLVADNRSAPVVEIH
jgi:uncharacterized membrane protein